jgi:hypothetical protein
MQNKNYTLRFMSYKMYRLKRQTVNINLILTVAGCHTFKKKLFLWNTNIFLKCLQIKL